MPDIKEASNIRQMTEKPEQPRKWKRNLALLLVPALISAFVVYLMWRTHPETSYWVELLGQGRTFLEEHPWALIAALATLPGIGFPISPIFVLFGVVLTPRYGMPMTVAIAIAAQTVCTIWTYALAAGPLREILKRYISQHREIPTMSDRNTLRLGLILRLAPGIPYAIQNVTLGIMGMRLRPYLLVSFPTTGMWTIGFVVTGGALFEGQAGLAIMGIALLIVLILVTRMFDRNNSENNG